MLKYEKIYIAMKVFPKSKLKKVVRQAKRQVPDPFGENDFAEWVEWVHEGVSNIGMGITGEIHPFWLNDDASFSYPPRLDIEPVEGKLKIVSIQDPEKFLFSTDIHLDWATKVKDYAGILFTFDSVYGYTYFQSHTASNEKIHVYLYAEYITVPQWISQEFTTAYTTPDGRQVFRYHIELDYKIRSLRIDFTRAQRTETRWNYKKDAVIAVVSSVVAEDYPSTSGTSSGGGSTGP